jgi:tetratricopeptide (TPR) repeat protein/2-polyprenyl-3-methyl-5-hydroxy-6-metoxy-1,4-benzoquinol methylase
MSPADPAQQNQRGLALQEQGRLDEAIACYRDALSLDPTLAAAQYNLGTALQAQGRLDEAVASYRAAISLRPDYAKAFANLGDALHDQGKLVDAVASYRRALSLRPQSARLHYNLGNALRQQSRLNEAIASYAEAIALKPGFTAAYNNLGTALREQGAMQQAIACFRQALSLEPDAAYLHHNLGSALKDKGDIDAAIASYRRALELNARDAEAHSALGALFQSRGAQEEAAAHYRNAVSLRPDDADAHNNLADALYLLGRPEDALASCRRALQLRDAPEFRTNFMRCIRHLEFARVDPGLRELVRRAVTEAWARPGELAVVASRQIALDQEIKLSCERAASAWPRRLTLVELLGARGLAALAEETLLLALLESCPVCDLALERLLTNVRRGLLEAAVAGNREAGDGARLEFHCALARQCFINEFVFSVNEDELREAGALRDRLGAALASGTPVAPEWIAAVGCYFPLLSVPGAASLRDRSFSAPLDALLRLQVDEPLEELGNRTTIHALTPIDDTVSRLVQQQYEENPYPRWMHLAPPGQMLSVNAYLRRQMPLAAFEPVDAGDQLEILVAGCGTGREPIDMARQFIDARVLAVDLSRSSLSYAMRKTRLIGLKNIEYAQADIMKLGSLDRTFDMIASVGVLHHLADPVAGWRALLPLLRPGGLMLLGLYSERARNDVAKIVAARQFIAERGYQPTAADIRRCREELMAAGGGREFLPLASFGDFYATSECRDLLFHVQEHRFTLPQIRSLLGTLGLAFVGFSLEPDVVEAYRRRFPDDTTASNLDHWHEFETGSANPFLGMYIFWVQKRRA